MKNVRTGSVRFMAIIAFGVLTAATMGVSCPTAAETAREACTHDALRLCGDTIPDVEQTKACLARNLSSLSPLCRSAFANDRPHGYHHRRRHVYGHATRS
jgi:hypothetical protein